MHNFSSRGFVEKERKKGRLNKICALQMDIERETIGEIWGWGGAYLVMMACYMIDMKIVFSWSRW